MKRLVLVAGLPGVGKTTITKKLSGPLGAAILDLDEIKKQIVDPDLVRTEIDPPEIRWMYYEEGLNYALALGAEVVLMDEVFHLDALRTRLEQLCTTRGVHTLWIEVRCSPAVVSRRLHATDRVGHILSTQEAVRMHRLFQEIFEKFPEGKSNHIVIDNTEG